MPRVAFGVCVFFVGLVFWGPLCFLVVAVGGLLPLGVLGLFVGGGGVLVLVVGVFCLVLWWVGTVVVWGV